MSIILSKKIGFCFGVKRAVKMAEEALKKKGPIYSLGSIIHNREAVERLSASGLKVIKDIGTIKKGVVVVSSHGLSPKAMKEMRKKGIEIVDTTCPFVRKTQNIARRLSGDGYTVLIVGDANHPEIRALLDFVTGKAVVIKDKRQAERLKPKAGEKAGIISQTTQSMDNFAEVVEAILRKAPEETRVFNTLCADAGQRQRLARQLAKKVDAMFVIGGRDSANTRRLYEATKRIQANSHLVETEKDIRRGWLERCRRIGVASGASTPDWMIKRVVKKINSIIKKAEN